MANVNLGHFDKKLFRTQQPVQAQPKGRSGLAKWLPTALAVGGSLAAAPFTGGASLLGTAALLGGGALLGGATGEGFAQRLSGEQTDVGKIGKEGLISGVTGAIPIGGVAKAAKVSRIAKASNEATPEAVTQTAKGIPVKYTPSVSKGSGSKKTANNLLINPTVGQVSDAERSLLQKGYKVNGQVKSAPVRSTGQNTQQPVVKMTGQKTTVPLTTEDGATQIIQPKPSVSVKTTETSVPPASTSRGSLLGKVKNNVQTSAKNTDMEVSGLKVGQPLRGGEVLTPERATELYDFARKGSAKYATKGVQAGKPIVQATNANKVYNGVVSALDDSLGKVNRTLKPEEISIIAKKLDQRLIDHPDIVGSTKLADKFKTLVAKQDIKGLEKLRREYDDIAYTAAGKAGNTAKAAEAKALRDTIDEFVTPLSKEYKAIKGDYSKAKELLTLSSKGSGSAKGINLFGNRIAPQGVSGLKSRIANKAAGSGTTEVAQRGLTNRTLREGVKQTVGHTLAGESPIFPTTPVGDPLLATDPQLTNPVDGTSAVPGSDLGVDGSQEPTADVQSQLDAAIQTALANGDTKGLDNLLKVADYYAAKEKASSTTSKPLSAEASKVLSNANSGLKSLDQLESMIAKGGVPKGTLVPGRGLLGGVVGNAAGTAGYDAAARNISDVITRLRTGAALTEAEAAFYNNQLPQAFDSPEVIQQKLGTFRDLFESVANRTGSPSTDLEALLTGATQ